MFIACGTILSIKDVADDRALETLLHGAPTEGNTVYEGDIERCVPVHACCRAWARLCCGAARGPVGWSVSWCCEIGASPLAGRSWRPPGRTSWRPPGGGLAS